VYVRIEGGTKLGGRVQEGKWIGMDDESKGARIYWPDSKTVTVERNIYFDNSSAGRFEEEEAVNVARSNINLPVVAPPIVVNQPPVVINHPDPVSDAPDTSNTESTKKRVRRPTKKVTDLLQGTGSWSTASKPKLAPGVQQPSADWTAVLV
jgi:hypothetical protein